MQSVCGITGMCVGAAANERVVNAGQTRTLRRGLPVERPILRYQKKNPLQVRDAAPAVLHVHEIL